MHLAMWPTPCTIGQVHLLSYYKAEMTYVGCHVDSSVVSAWNDVGVGLYTAVVSGT